MALSGDKPFGDLSVHDISEVSVSVNYYGVVHALSDLEVNELVKTLRKVVIYERNDSHSLYAGGQDLTFNIIKTDGSELSVMGHISTIVIDGIGYDTNEKPLGELHRLGGSFVT